MCRKIIVSFLFFFCAGAFAHAQEIPYTIPEFTFYKMDDTPFTREDLSRTSNIVFVFFSTTCHHCQDETRAMGEHSGDFDQSTLYFISKENKSDIRKFMDTYGKQLKDKSNVHVLRDPQSEFVLKFNPTQYPSVYIYTPTRQLVKHFSGETPISEITAALK
ncbi:AhpC/TSA family protein [Anseongella ginsenosidimutans]|uniref:AhpC/TSA family protein n=1 Tax=Anseongella ginsenosidimutans TaxID=496056 RepID=A0A4R3KP16_9SPHI|nr:redoxin domain-containing protein [Anseongella ginsenosidimutans]QEC53943.1 redoxin domain-containing protein [Anseongella ginsenosidimutans]TCS86330.1 AhpC/TSA family protein [Anseongella ginsenosidimutans]